MLRRLPLIALLRLFFLVSFLFLAFSLLRYPTAPPPPTLMTPPFAGVAKIAFLFLVKSNLPLDFVWDAFFKSAGDGMFSVYVHSMPGFVLDESTTQSRFFYGRQLSTSVKVDWGGSSMTMAERLLFAAALKDPANQRFLLLSDSCVPLYNFSYVYHYLMSSSKSFVDSFLDNKEGRYNSKMAPVIPREKWRKGTQWVTLVRKHAEVVVADSLLFPVFSKHCKRHWGSLSAKTKFQRRKSLELKQSRNMMAAAQTVHDCIPDEHYVQALFSIHNLETEQEKRTLTYTLWNQSTDHSDKMSWHPKTFYYADANPEEINNIKGIDHVQYDTEQRTEWCQCNGKSVPCFLFARKFTPSAARRLLSEWRVGVLDTDTDKPS